MNHPEEISLDESTPVNRVDDAWRQAKLVLERKGIKNFNDALVGTAAVAALSPAELRRVVQEEKEKKTDGSVSPSVITRAKDHLDYDLYSINAQERMRTGGVGAVLGAVAISWAMNMVGGHYEDGLNLRLYGATMGSVAGYLIRRVWGGIRAGVDRQSLARQKVDDVARYTSQDTPSEES